MRKIKNFKRKITGKITKLMLFLILFAYGIDMTAQTYHSDDKEGLRIFLRQPSAEAGKINAQQLGLQISDTLNWQTNEAWVTMIPGLVWNNENPKRLIEIDGSVFQVVSAIATSATSVAVTFSGVIDPVSVIANGNQFTFSGGLTASAAVVSNNTVTVTTSLQTADQSHTVTVVNTVKNVQGKTLSAPFSANFTGFTNLPQVNMRPLIANAENTGSKFRVSGEIYIEGITDLAGQGAGITAEVGYGPHGGSSAAWTWFAAGYLGDDVADGKDVYGGVLTAFADGTFDVAVRFTYNSNKYITEVVALQIFAGQDVSIHWGNVQWPTACYASPAATSAHIDPETQTSEIYGRVYYPGITESPTQNTALKAQLGIGIGDPLTDDWSWTDATWNTKVSGDNNHEYRAQFRAPSLPGTYKYVYRYRVNAGWTYCGAGAGTIDANFDPATSGVLTVTNY